MPVKSVNFVVEVKHPRTDDVHAIIVEINPITAPELDLRDADAGLEGILELAEEVGRQARKDAASRYVNYDGFTNESDYSDALDNLADSMEIMSMGKAGNLLRFVVDASFGEANGNGPFAEDVMAVDVSDAEFRTAWKMGISCGGKPAEFDDFLTTMGEIEIHASYLEPVSPDRVKELLAGLYAAIESGEGVDQIMSDTRVALEAMEMLPAPAAPRM